MIKRTFAVTLLLALAQSGFAANDARRPNLLFVLTDDHRWNALGCAGDPIVKTPQIDKLASQGVRFTNAFVTTSICCTSRASIFTGQYARRHGINDFGTPFTPAQIAQIYPTLLHKAGYRTGFIGKFGVGDKGKMPVEEFDYFKGFPGQGKYWPKAKDGGTHLTDVMTSQGLEFIAGCKADQPFCLSISYKAPHAQDPDARQYLYAPRYKDLYEDVTIPLPPTATDADFRAQPDFLRNSEARKRWDIRFATPASYQAMIKGYYRLITQVDDSVGQIMDALRTAGLDQNTVVIFMGDNGYYFGEHGLADKWFPHEESIRVPLIIRDPRAASGLAGKTRDEMALNIDIAPTLLSLACVDVPKSMQGLDLTPLVRGEHPAWRQEFFYEHHFKHPGIPMSDGVRTGRYVYWRYLNVDHDAEWLFDLQGDPTETKNLVDAAPTAPILAALRAKTTAYGDSLK